MPEKISRLFHSWARGWLILVIFAVFVAFEALTLPTLQAAPGGRIESLDTQLFYTPEEAFTTIGLYGDSSTFWIRTYLTWDVVNPILYTLIFALFLSWLFQRSFKPESKLQRMNLLPLGAGLFDFLENISIVTMLSAYPAQPTVVAWLSTVFTLSKISFLAVSALLILFGLVKAAMNKFKRQ